MGVLGPLFRTAGHTTQHGVTASAGQRRGDVEIRNYVQDGEMMLFIGTRFSNLYTAVHTPAWAACVP